MKKFLLGSAAVLLSVTLFAQPEDRPGGPPKPPPVAERWKHDSVKLQLYVGLNAAQTTAVKTTFLSFYNDADALMQQAKNNPPVSEAMERIHTKRNTALKAIFNAQQFDRFETFEREFMPPPPKPPKPDANEHV